MTRGHGAAIDSDGAVRGDVLRSSFAFSEPVPVVPLGGATNSAELLDAVAETSIMSNGKLLRCLYIGLAASIGAAAIWGDAGSWDWFLHGYAWDIALPVFAYFLVQQVCGADGGWELALLLFAICSAGELAQLILPRYTFDLWDLVAYALGSLLALVLDAITPSGRTETSESAGTEARR
jgi:hypothetical protein